MDLIVFGMVIAAALLHAVWNAILKIQGDRLVVMALLTGFSGLFSLLALPFVDVPPPAAWPYLGASFVIHNIYYLLLVVCYRFGDFSHVYPIARGSAPLLVTAISVVILGEHLDRNGLIAVGIIGLSLMALAQIRHPTANWRPFAAAMATGVFIALYTVIDGLGIRAAGDPHGYTFWLFFFDAFPLMIIVVVLKRRETLRLLRANFWLGLFAGFISLFATWLVMWALALAPTPYVSALRETSLIFAVIIGAVFMKERIDLRRWLAVLTTMAGTILLKTGR